MEFFIDGYPPVPLPWKKINLLFPNKVRVIRNILKSNKIARDSRHFEGKSIFYKSKGRLCHNRGQFLLIFFMFQTILNIMEGSSFLYKINYFEGWGVPPPPIPNLKEQHLLKMPKRGMQKARKGLVLSAKLCTGFKMYPL